MVKSKIGLMALYHWSSTDSYSFQLSVLVIQTAAHNWKGLHLNEAEIPIFLEDFHSMLA